MTLGLFCADTCMQSMYEARKDVEMYGRWRLLKLRGAGSTWRLGDLLACPGAPKNLDSPINRIIGNYFTTGRTLSNQSSIFSEIKKRESDDLGRLTSFPHQPIPLEFNIPIL